MLDVAVFGLLQAYDDTDLREVLENEYWEWNLGRIIL